MICPVDKKDMIVVEYQDIELDMCLECHGVWFDSGELGLLMKLHHSGDIDDFIEWMQKNPDVDIREKQRKCPICGKKMSKKRAGAHPEVIIDVCPNGHGLWFDGGEVVQFAEQVATSEDTGDGDSTDNAALDYIREFFGNLPK